MRELSLIEAELEYCLSEIADFNDEKAKIYLERADAIRKNLIPLVANVDNKAAVVASMKAINACYGTAGSDMRIVELYARYTRLLMEFATAKYGRI